MNIYHFIIFYFDDNVDYNVLTEKPRKNNQKPIGLRVYEFYSSGHWPVLLHYCIVKFRHLFMM